ncbi:NAD(P)-dependent oxidoreductase [Priestia megaterium]|nr:NAD(P)-dependent oxidoreductase [Priestia megaterium]
MGNIVVIGANRFVGFRICTAFLENGEEVSGYTHPAHESEKSLQDEMKFLLGRNANFKTEEVGNSLAAITHDTDIVYFAYFDGGDFYHSDFLRNEMNHAQQFLRDTLVKCTQTDTKFVLISTMRVFGKHQEMIDEHTLPEPDNSEGRLLFHFEQIVLKYKQSGLQCMIVRIPNVYGPWQPLSMCYSQAIIKRETPTIREGTDCIAYIEDIVQSLVHCKDVATPYELIHLFDDQISEWNEGAKILHIQTIDDTNREDKYQVSEKGKQLLHYRSSTPLKEGIFAQKKHMRMLFLPF